MLFVLLYFTFTIITIIRPASAMATRSTPNAEIRGSSPRSGTKLTNGIYTSGTKTVLCLLL